MGTTLSNGVYLPDEGERNCYAGLKVNWEILNQKVADIVALQSAIAGALHREIVESLPTTDINPNTIYMVLSGTSATENVYNEFMYVNNAWELIGTSATDLTNYYTKGDVDGLLVLKANASDLTSHTGDTDIHVTASDKTKWTNSANTVVLRLAKTALTPSSSTNAFSNLDDSTALKVGDKVMDTAGVLFEVTAIDTANSTFTVGTALIDLAQDSDVVHKSGNETVAGYKVFENICLSNSIKAINLENQTIDLNNCYSLFGIPQSGNISFYFCNTNDGTANISNLPEQRAFFLTSQGIRILSSGSVVYLKQTLVNSNGKTFVRYCNNSVWGSWQNVTNLVTTDTNQTISGAKTFTDNIVAKKIVSNVSQLQINAKTNADSVAMIGGDSASEGGGVWVYGKNTSNKSMVTLQVYDTDASTYHAVRLNMDGSLTPTASNNGLGSSSFKWKSVNGINPGALGMPDLSNGVDISSYITDLTGASNINKYTPTVDGWISIGLSNADYIEIYVATNLMGASFAKNTLNNSGLAFMPVIANKEVKIALKGSSIGWAKFYPCRGNV